MLMDDLLLKLTNLSIFQVVLALIIHVGVHEFRYCQIGSISQPLENPIAARSISGKSTNSQRSFDSMSLFGEITPRKYLMIYILK